MWEYNMWNFFFLTIGTLHNNDMDLLMQLELIHLNVWVLTNFFSCKRGAQIPVRFWVFFFSFRCVYQSHIRLSMVWLQANRYSKKMLITIIIIIEKIDNLAVSYFLFLLFISIMRERTMTTKLIAFFVFTYRYNAVACIMDNGILRFAFVCWHTKQCDSMQMKLKWDSPFNEMMI